MSCCYDVREFPGSIEQEITCGCVFCLPATIREDIAFVIQNPGQVKDSFSSTRFIPRRVQVAPMSRDDDDQVFLLNPKDDSITNVYLMLKRFFNVYKSSSWFNSQYRFHVRHLIYDVSQSPKIDLYRMVEDIEYTLMSVGSKDLRSGSIIAPPSSVDCDNGIKIMLWAMIPELLKYRKRVKFFLRISSFKVNNDGTVTLNFYPVETGWNAMTRV